MNLNFGAKIIEFENFFEPGLSDNLNHRAKIRDFGKLQNQHNSNTYNMNFGLKKWIFGPNLRFSNIVLQGVPSKA